MPIEPPMIFRFAASGVMSLGGLGSFGGLASFGGLGSFSGFGSFGGRTILFEYKAWRAWCQGFLFTVSKKLCPSRQLLRYKKCTSRALRNSSLTRFKIPVKKIFSAPSDSQKDVYARLYNYRRPFYQPSCFFLTLGL